MCNHLCLLVHLALTPASSTYPEARGSFKPDQSERADLALTNLGDNVAQIGQCLPNLGRISAPGELLGNCNARKDRQG